MQRREFLKSMAAGLVMLGGGPLYGASQGADNKKLIWVILRGGMDSIHAVVPLTDPHLAALRSGLIDPMRNELLPMAKGFSLHPSFKTFHQWFNHGELIPVVATASPYRARSHFDAQDMLECGLNIIDHDTGWLARAVSQLNGNALAIARSVPISLRGIETSNTWFPSTLPEAQDDLFESLRKLYRSDPILARGLEEGFQMREAVTMGQQKKGRPKFTQLARYCGELMSGNDAYSGAMLEMGGWDTHNNQVSRLKRQFSMLDNGMAVLKESLGDQWKNTVVIMATEFGRTVAMNGTRGTDHGTASCMFIAGGAIQGGNVLGMWPGLSKNRLYQERDLMPTSDIRSWQASVLMQHWKFSQNQIRKVFPGVKPMPVNVII